MNDAKRKKKGVTVGRWLKVLFGLIAAIIGSGYVYFIYKGDILSPQNNTINMPINIGNNVTVDGTERTSFIGEDEEGNKVLYELVILHNKEWKLNSSDSLEGNIEDFHVYFDSVLCKSIINDSSKGYIAIGLASYEGEDKADQEWLAWKRAGRIIEEIEQCWIGNNTKLKKVYTLNLGQRVKDVSDVSASQRKVVIVGIKDWEQSFDDSVLEKTLKNGMLADSIRRVARFNIEDYSMFDDFELVPAH